MIHPGWHERVLNDVRGRVGRRECDRDHKIRSNETEQHENEKLPFPTRQQCLEHRLIGLLQKHL